MRTVSTLLLPAMLVVALILVGGRPLNEADPAAASHAGGADAFAIDMDPGATPGNTATSLGSMDPCARINENDILDADEDGVDSLSIDVVAGPAGIPASNPIIGFYFTLNYSAGTVSVTAADANFLIASGANSSIFSGDDSLPDTDGSWTGGALDINSGAGGNVPETGPGVLERVSVESTATALPGLYPITLANAAHVNSSSDAFAPDSLGNAWVSIGLICPPVPPVIPPLHSAPVHQKVLDELLIRPEVPIIVSLNNTPIATEADLPGFIEDIREAQDRVLAAVGAPGFELKVRWEAVPGFAGDVTAAGLATLRTLPDVVAVEYDSLTETDASGDMPFADGGGGASHPGLEQSVSLIGANAAHSSGVTGAGVEAAIIDTGIYNAHQDLDEDIASEHCFSTNPANPPCPGPDPTECHGFLCAATDNGHGTHVSGIVTSCGCNALAGIGVAPDAKIHMYRERNISDGESALNDIISRNTAGTQSVDLINMSWFDPNSGTHSLPGECENERPSFAAAIHTLRVMRVTSFVSAGNQASISFKYPACLNEVLSVAATYDESGRTYVNSCTETTVVDKVTCFSNHSSYCTTTCLLDLFAPGAIIRSDWTPPELVVEESGTSMSAPMAMAVAALALEATPTHTTDSLELCLKSTGVTVIPRPGTAVSAKRVNAAAAIGCAGDADGDGDLDNADNCLNTPNPDQTNVDGDSLGDACDPGDFDGDKLSDQAEYFCGAPPNDGTKRPERVDGAFAGISDDGDAAVDEALPTAAANYDCDGDGFTGSAEEWVYIASGGRDQDSCGTNGWPAELASSGISANKITLTDVSSFVALPKKLNTSPGDSGYNVRWDLVPGSTVGKKINLVDISRITTLVPPMLGARAFGGPVCPWSP